MPKQTPLIRKTPFTNRWVCITKYKPLKGSVVPGAIEATEKFDIHDQIEAIIQSATQRTSMERIESFKGPHAFLSNFHPSPLTYEGVVYPTSEHAFQAAKTLDIEARKKIAALSTPGKAKAAGKKVALRDNWNNIRVDIMREIVTIKFDTHPDLARELLATDNAELIEGNTWMDRFWGVCKGSGQNWLGKILMEVRDALRRKTEAD